MPDHRHVIDFDAILTASSDVQNLTRSAGKQVGVGDSRPAPKPASKPASKPADPAFDRALRVRPMRIGLR